MAHGRIKGLDVSRVRAAPGVVDVLTAEDIPGVNDVSPTGKHDEPVFPTDKVEFHGQAIFAVIADTRDAARRAAELADVEYEVLPHAIDAVSAHEAGMPLVTDPLKLERGDVDTAFESVANRITARMVVGGQDHMYLKGISPLPFPARTTM